jgi:DNA-binding transcriptional LysR family regulator
MTMDRLRAMHYFIRAVELGSLSAAARELGTTQPTVSKALAGLERELEVRLMERSTAGLAPTDQGQRFYERAKHVVEEYEHAVAQARGLTGQASGLLRINAPVAFGQLRLNALVQAFLQQYPDIAIELILNDRYVDLVEEGVDVALRLGGNLPQDAVARSVAVSPRLLVAAPAYLETHGPLHHPSELSRHDYVRFAWLDTGDEVQLLCGQQRVQVTTKGRYRVNNAIAIRETLAMGAGIGLCPAWLVNDLVSSGQLVHVLPAWHGVAQELHMLYPSRRYQPLRAKLLLDFLAERILALDGFSACDAAARVPTPP